MFRIEKSRAVGNTHPEPPSPSLVAPLALAGLLFASELRGEAANRNEKTTPSQNPPVPTAVERSHTTLPNPQLMSPMRVPRVSHGEVTNSGGVGLNASAKDSSSVDKKATATTRDVWSLALGGLGTLISAIGTIKMWRDPEREKFARTAAHPVSWFGWTVDAFLGVATVIKSGAIPLALLRSAHGIINVMGTCFAFQGEKQRNPQIWRGIHNYLLDEKERPNLICLGLSLAALATTFALRVTGYGLEGVGFQVVSGLALAAYIITSLPTVLGWARDLKNPLPRADGASVKDFMRSNFAAVSWPLSCLCTAPVPFLTTAANPAHAWTIWAWGLLPIVGNSILCHNAWRGYVRGHAQDPSEGHSAPKAS